MTFKRLVGSPLFWVVFVIGMMTWPIVRAVTAPALPPPPPMLGVMPSFRLTDQHGREYGSDELRGRVWIANFIFTRCPTVCPAFTQKMANLQRRARHLGDAMHLVTFTVDPAYDTPAVLDAFASQYGATARWSFLTGPVAAIKHAVTDGLKTAMGNEGDPGDFMKIFHGEHFVLIDAEMNIRGFYAASDADSEDKLMRDAGLVVNHTH